MKTTKYALAVALGFMALLAPGAVRADTIFTASGVCCGGPAGADTLSGTVTINTTTGVIDGIALQVSGFKLSDSFTTILTQGDSIAFNPSLYRFETKPSTSGSGHVLFIVFPVASLVGYAGGDLCSATFPCPQTTGFAESTILSGISTSTPWDSVQLTPVVTPVPEPTAIILLGAGLLSLMVWNWRRKRLA